MSGPQYITGDGVSKVLASLPHQGLSEADYEKRIVQKKKAQARDRQELLLTRSNAPRRHLETSAKFDGDFKERFEKVAAMRKTGYLVAFIGGWGTGKTQLAVELMKDRSLKGGRSTYHTAMELLMMFKATYSSDNTQTEMGVVKMLAQPELLVIDEAAKRGETDWENRLMFEILNKRYADYKDTILIANQTREAFSKSMGPSVTRRMSEVGGLMVF